MKRLLLGLMLLMTATAASAEWTPIGSGDSFIQYADKATIRPNGNFVKMWLLYDFKTVRTSVGHSYLSEKAQMENDCKEERLRVLALSWFSGQMGSGNVVYSDSDAGKWTPVAPGSIGEIQWNIACGKK